MNWAERQKERGVRLELTPHDGRCWKKFRDGKTHYLPFPVTKEGYEAALLEWAQRSARLNGERPNAKLYHHHREVIGLVQQWYDHFGVAKDEARLSKYVAEFLAWIEELLKQPELPGTIPVLAFTTATKRPEFLNEFGTAPGAFGLGSQYFRLSSKWQERIRQLDDAPGVTKLPQTVQFWIEQYLTRVKSRAGRVTTIGTAKDRTQKLGKYKEFSDTSKHVTTITSKSLEAYHDVLDEQPLVKKTKEEYFAAFRMFVRWASGQDECEMVRPENLDSKEFSFREPDGTGRKRLAKKKLLWQPEDFETALKSVPQPYRCYLIVSLNCGFRSTDLNALRKDDLNLKDARITIQREKMNQNDTSPVVSYPLWATTVSLIKDAMSDDPTFVFRGRNGNPLIVKKIVDGEPKTHDNLSRYWNNNRDDFGLEGKRLDFIRKTGATEIQRIKRGIETLYLGEALDEVAKINYSFTDGEPCPDLDEAIQELGVRFGLVKATKKRNVQMSSDVLNRLERKARDEGLTLEQLLASL
ncbi:MAG TPA: tyrosine-type recombinase/integrase [Planctomycetaceae bacterium]|jgi:integrase|nr:tyrosine-type recombinase/integrase [Planctomycetaceae bacterium]